MSNLESQLDVEGAGPPGLGPKRTITAHTASVMLLLTLMLVVALPCCSLDSTLMLDEESTAQSGGYHNQNWPSLLTLLVVGSFLG